MPKRKTLPAVPDYEGTPTSDIKLVIQKSNPLIALSKTDMTLFQLKILDFYLSRINTHEPEKRWVRIDKGNLERLLGVTRIHTKDLKNRLKGLGTMVDVEVEKDRFKQVALFEIADCERDDEGYWQVDLKCTGAAMEYIFNIDNIGYLRYMLKDVSMLISRYSYILYLYLKQNAFRESWEISIDELKEMLNCNSRRYEVYKYFNAEVLKKCQMELNEKTSLCFTYTPIKQTGRKYTSIKFTVESIFGETISEKKSLEVPNENDETDIEEEKKANYGGELAELLAEMCDYEFNSEQIRVLQDLILQKVGHNHLKCADYLSHQVNIMNEREERMKKTGNGIGIKNRYAYLKKMLEADLAEMRQAEMGQEDSSTSTNTKQKESWGRDSTFDIEEISKLGIL